MYYKMEIDFSGRSDLTTGTVATHTHTDPQGGITGAAGSHSHTVAGVQQTIFRDFYLGVKDLPYLGRVQVGHFKEPFGLEELTSDKFLCFTERGLTGAFTPARNMGVMAINNIFGENATWAAGLFRTMGDTPPYLADDRGFYSATARTTWLPWYDEATDGRGLLHVGGAYSYRDFADSSVRISQRPEVGAGPNVVDTRIAGVDALTRVTNEHLGGVEAALVYGPFSLQSEYMTAIFQRTAGLQEANFSGGYVYATFFLTGENRVYRRQTGTFDRIRPNTNFFRVRADDCTIETGWGAWEVGYRFSFVNLDNAAAAVYGGYAADHTIGVNWYLTPYMKVMADYVRSNASTQNNGPNVWIDAFVLRAAIDF
jgi:phosphate-selective porin OprO/OprP